MTVMVWLAVGVLAVVVMMAAVAIARRNADADSGGDGDLGSISGSWLNEHRAHERESNHNR